MLSKACQYAIKSLIFLGKNRDQGKIPLKSIADEIDSPPAFTSKILQQPVSAAVLTSAKGGKGGFEITNHGFFQFTIGNIISLIDGDGLSHGCLLGFPQCSGVHPCPVHHSYVEIKNKLNHSLFNITINKLILKNPTGMKL
ncbi:MAG: Rrf2 family transcriptional regulator [Saprospiraceae bacterium]|nr:Rrf2 family transcriptional regulator [Saprospiraceae bacterium]